MSLARVKTMKTEDHIFAINEQMIIERESMEIAIFPSEREEHARNLVDLEKQVASLKDKSATGLDR